jgi:leucyl-tRNA synthetase
MILGEDNEKMSKSRGNVVNPDNLVSEYGADAVRTYMMFMGPWDQGAPWNYQGIEGVTRFLNRVWNVVADPSTEAPAASGAPETASRELRRAVHHAIKEVTDDFEAFQFNTAVAELMTLQNALSRPEHRALAGTPAWREAVRALLLLLAPIAPHVSEELWHRSGFEGSVHLQDWPDHDAEALARATVRLAVQVNGKLREQRRALPRGRGDRP